MNILKISTCFLLLLSLNLVHSKESMSLKIEEDLNTLQNQQLYFIQSLKDISASLNESKNNITSLGYITASLKEQIYNLDENLKNANKQQANIFIDFENKINGLRYELNANLSNIETQYKSLAECTLKNYKSLQVLEKKVNNQDNIYKDLKNTQIKDSNSFNNKLNNINNDITNDRVYLKDHILYGAIISGSIFFVLIIVFYVLLGRIKKSSSSIENVRKAQEALVIAQNKMQEESIKLDNKLLEFLEKQIQIKSNKESSTNITHTLTLKIADEIVRIETNLSRMDPSIRGYKQLLKAVQKMKENFLANDYEIVDMLGKPYVQGMKAAVSFVSDPDLEEGQQIITKVIKPQINYQQQMIQAAQIEVSQSE